MKVKNTPCLSEIAALERACLTAVPAQRVAFDGPFVLRAFLGGTGRANAASAVDPTPDADLPARIARIETRYRSLGLPVRFRSTPLDPPGLGDILRGQGYVEKDETIIFAAPIEAIAQADGAVTFSERPDEAWMAVTATAEHQVPARRAEKERAVSMLMVPGAWAVLREAAEPVACISIVADGDYAGFFDLAVKPEARRRGLGSRITRAAADWAKGLGASQLWAQVASANIASCTAQRQLGLQEIYRYVYLVRPEDKLPALHFG